MLEERFVRDVDSLIERGSPDKIRDFDSAPYRDHVPESLDLIWSRCGVASWADGSFTSCDPATVQDICMNLLQKYEFLKDKLLVPYIISAYGIVRAWNKIYGQVEIQFPLARIVLTTSPAALRAKQPSETTLISRFPTNSKRFSVIEGFEQDRKRLGRLGENEVYGFFPALAFGGGSSPDHVQRVQADVHLDFLAGLQPFQLLYFDGRGYSPVEEG